LPVIDDASTVVALVKVGGDVARLLAEQLLGRRVSVAMPAAQSAVLGAVRLNEVGKASGIFNTSRFLGGTFGIAVAAAAFAAAGNVAGERALGLGSAAAIGMSAAPSLAAAFRALALPANRKVSMAQAKAKA
jgi:hypothetical protein